MQPVNAYHLYAGLTSMIFEDGVLRAISIGACEVVRMIYFSVRDKDWLTIPAKQSGLKIENNKSQGFWIRFTNRYTLGDIDFRVRITYKGSASGRLSVSAKGTALNGFLKNRIGFCVLHPLDTCIGRRCMITHSDGSVSSDIFPDRIAPHQPFTDITSMSWIPEAGIGAMLKFYGEVFETEDQRNWTDASFKTYSTPLALPRPVMIEKGSRVSQRITLKVNAKRMSVRRKEPVTIQLTGGPVHAFPEIGTVATSRLQPVTETEAERIRSIGFSHLRVDLHLDDENLELEIKSKRRELELTRLPAELCLFFGKHAQSELDRFLLSYSPLPVSRILIFSKYHPAANTDLIVRVLTQIRKAFPSIPCGTGTNCNFAELNRAGNDFIDVDLLAFAIHPQEHASDNQTLIENTAAQSHAVKSALYEGLPVYVTPISLQRRFNANKEYYESRTEEARTETLDCRQMSLFAAAWTVGSLKYLCGSGATGLTYYETVGERGIQTGDFDPMWKEFKATRDVFPVFHVIKALLENKPVRVVECVSSHPFIADALVFETDSRRMILMANMTRTRHIIRVSGMGNLTVRMTLHAGNFSHLTHETEMPTKVTTHENGMLALRPYEIVLAESGIPIY